ncbi:MAG: hypothetical protein E7653_07175 [Ruminococcaceae bacterium]|nr:hypothetical protein [Oscillospiraceae bacterium]
MKKENKSNNKALIITALVCVCVVAVLLFVLICGDMIAGKSALSKTRKGIKGSDAVVISDPAYNDSILPTTAEVVLTGDAAKQMADKILSLTDGASFHNTLTSSAGFWDTCMRFEDGKDTYAIYLGEDSFYVVKNDVGYIFNVDKNAKEEYNVFCESVDALIKEKADSAQ